MEQAAAIDASVVVTNVAEVRARIARAGGEGRTRLVAVTKGFGIDAMLAAAAAGADALGESYAQEFEHKLVALGAVLPLPLHFIGRIQRNKVRALASHVALWHSVDRVEVGDEISRRAPGASVLVQVNISDEPQKGGCAPSEVEVFVATLRRQGLDVQGLMAVGPSGAPELARSGFEMLAARVRDLGLVELSIGMSDDLEVAVACGATMVRIGRSLFGARPSPSLLAR